eukprot:scaffold495834_cov23-Prasinocladus_malaysianus.AAC.1
MLTYSQLRQEQCQRLREKTHDAPPTNKNSDGAKAERKSNNDKARHDMKIREEKTKRRRAKKE